MELTSETDEALMVLYQKGEYKAFQELYERHSGRVYGYLKGRMSDASEAEDLVQQAFLKLHQSRDRFDANYPFLPWLFCIARNLQIDFMRKYKATPMDVEKFESMADETEPTDTSVEIDSSIQGLTSAQRELINLRFKQGLSFDEISDRIGVTSSTARKQVSRIISSLRKVLASKKIEKGTRS